MDPNFPERVCSNCAWKGCAVGSIGSGQYLVVKGTEIQAQVKCEYGPEGFTKDPNDSCRHWSRIRGWTNLNQEADDNLKKFPHAPQVTSPPELTFHVDDGAAFAQILLINLERFRRLAEDAGAIFLRHGLSADAWFRRFKFAKEEALPIPMTRLPEDDKAGFN